MYQLKDLPDLMREGWVAFRFPKPVFDVEDLRDLYEYARTSFPKVVPLPQYPKYGGWSLLSGTGDYRDGWQPGGFAYTVGGTRFGAVEELPATTRTSLCENDAADDLLRSFNALGLTPIRTRIAEIEGEGGNNWHVDSPPRAGGRWRAHIVVVTNPTSTFEWRKPSDEVSGDTHLIKTAQLSPDGRLYLIRADVEHRVRNQVGLRTHIISDFLIRDYTMEVEPFVKL